MNVPHNVKGICTIATIGIVTLLGAYWLFKTQKKKKLPKKWVEVGKVTKLFVYPLKSGRRVELQTGDCTQYGLVTRSNEIPLRDRSFVVYSETSLEFKTGRTHPKMVLIKIDVHDKGHVVFDAPDQRPLYVKVPTAETPKSGYIKLHAGEMIDTIDCGDEAASWFSRYLLDQPTGFRLGYHDMKFRRDVTKSKEKYWQVYKKVTNDSMGMYSDLTSYLLMNEASVAKLNEELEEPVTEHNFRPNIMVSGNIPAFAEECWDYVKIGTAVFKNVKPCTRCILTTVNPEDGTKSNKREPLNTLEKLNVLKDPAYLKIDGRAPVMGIQMGLVEEGNIVVDDVVYAATA